MRSSIRGAGTESAGRVARAEDSYGRFVWPVSSRIPYAFQSLKTPPLPRVARTAPNCARNGTISGAIRVQYSFLIPKYPIPSFAIYSCLGNMKFTARPVR